MLFSVWVSAQAQPKNWLVLGDSISAGYGIPTSQSWVQLLQQKLKSEHAEIQITNASVSGETTAGGLSRLPNLLANQPFDLVIVELGGNDGLRGLSLDSMRANLAQIIEQCQAKGAKVILLGMKLPPNYGIAYNQAFEDIYQNLAQKYQVPLVSFFLQGVGGHTNMMQADGVHPNFEAQPILLENAWKVLEPLVNKHS